MPHIELSYEGKEKQLTHARAQSGEVLSLGRGHDCDGVVRREFGSGNHAHIEVDRNDFLLVDESTNGTFVQTEDERVQFVHRNRVRLWGSGWISLGETLHAGNPVLCKETVSAVE